LHEYVIHNLKKGDYVMLPKGEYESMKATIETLEDQEVLKQIVKSEKEILEGKTIGLDEWKKKNKL
jgi:PHD/YefM family antitoxin component YafN of YafNO toxin-antitoxin module